MDVSVYEAGLCISVCESTLKVDATQAQPPPLLIRTPPPHTHTPTRTCCRALRSVCQLVTSGTSSEPLAVTTSVTTTIWEPVGRFSVGGAVVCSQLLLYSNI